MLSYHAYKFIHLIGVFLVLMSLGGQLVRMESSTWRKYLTISHGVGLLLLVLAGFGLLARLGVGWPWPIWIVVKGVVWVFFGLTPIFLKRGYLSTTMGWWAVLCLAGLSAYLATFKPFI